jgi:hypothetical protein
MHRRQVLTTVCISALPFAGCLDSGAPPATDARTSTSGRSDTPTPTPSTDRTLAVGETYESAEGTTVTVEDVRVRKLVRSTSAGSPTHVDVACLDGHQFAVVDVEAADAEGDSILEDIRLFLAVDGGRYPQADQHWYWAFPPGSYARPGLPAVPVPPTAATDAAIVWSRDADPVVRWNLSSETVNALGRSPAFTVRSFETPDSARRGTSFEATFTVANTGERDGHFTTEFGAGPISDHGEVTIEVPPGAERTHSGRLDPHYPESRDEIDVTLDWGCDRRRRTVAVTD